MSGDSEVPETDGIELSDYWEDVSSITTMSLEQTRQGFLHKPLHHGVCELQVRPDETGPGSRIRGLIVVRTSITELASAFYTTSGMNVIVVVIIAVLGFMILVAVTFSSILGFSLNLTITSSVAALKRGAERLRKGDLDARISLATRGELGRLAESFNQMAADIKALIEKVAEKERLDRELQIAREIQIKLLPADLPQVTGFDLAATSRPAREVAGDYYDALLLEPGRLVLVVADVSGKGVAAAMLMSNLQAALHALLHQNLPLDNMVGRLNEVVYKNSTPEMFITFFVAIIDTSSLILEYVNAGHEQPFLIRQDETIELGPCGLILGAMPEAPYRLGRVLLRAGDMLALYSDGITEAMNADEEEFDKERLTAALAELQEESAADVLRGVLDRVQTHCGAGSMPRDDLTFVVARIVSDRDH
jgi:serine phosphatase RsbU (regulator of sigma subunit)